MIEQLEVTNRHVIRAEYRADQIGELRNSITKGEGNTAGFIGEIVLAERIGGVLTVTVPELYHYDMMVCDIRIDAKTKRCNSMPHSNYLCPIPDFNTKQECDYYVFLRLLNDLTKGRAWLCGAIGRDEFYRVATFYHKGDVDPEFPSFHFTCDCFAVPISILTPVHKILPSFTHVN